MQTAGLASGVSQVAYEVVGNSRSLLEAAAQKGFCHVSVGILDKILEDVEGPHPGVKGHHQKATHVICLFKDEWKWSEVDVARALMKRPSSRACPGSGVDPAEVDFWRDIPSIVAALESAAAATAAQDMGNTNQPKLVDLSEHFKTFSERSIRFGGRRAGPEPHQFPKSTHTGTYAHTPARSHANTHIHTDPQHLHCNIVLHRKFTCQASTSASHTREWTRGTSFRFDRRVVF